MSDTCGPTSPTPWAYYDPDSSSWKTCAATFPWDSTASSPTLPEWGTWADGVLSELPTSERATKEHASSSLLPTPAASEAGGTPERHLERKNLLDGAKRTKVTELSLFVKLLPTPTRRDWKDGSPCEHVEENALLGRVVWRYGANSPPPSPATNTSSDDQHPHPQTAEDDSHPDLWSGL